MRWWFPLALVLIFCISFPATLSAQEAVDGVDADVPSADQTLPTHAGPIAIEQRSPRATMFTFLAAMNRIHDGYDDAWPAVYACFDVPDDADAVAVQLAAEQLKRVVDRLGEIREHDLLSAEQIRTDAVRENRDPVRRFSFFPQTHHAWVWEKLGRAPQGFIVLVQGADDRWRFSSATFTGMAELYESMRDLPPLYDPHERQVTQVMTVLGPTFDQTWGWGWLILLGMIFVGLLAGKVVQGLLLKLADKWAQRGWKIRGLFFEDAAGPVSLTLLAVGLRIGLDFIFMEPPIRQFSNNIILLLLLLALAWYLYNLVNIVDVGLRRMAEKTRSSLDNQVVPLIRKSLRIFLLIIFSLLIAQNVFGLNITGWLAGLGIVGLAVSLSAQDSIKNLFGSVTIFFDKPFAVGDRISFNGFDCIIEEIGFRATRARTLTGHLVTIPNMKFIDSIVENIAKRPSIRRIMNITITYDTPPEKIEQATQILRDILMEEESIKPFDMEKMPPRVYFNDFNADSLNLFAIYWYMLKPDEGQDWWGYNAHGEIINKKIFQRFGEAGIDFAFPTQTLYLAGDPDRQLTVNLRKLPGEGGGIEGR